MSSALARDGHAVTLVEARTVGSGVLASERRLGHPQPEHARWRRRGWSRPGCGRRSTLGGAGDPPSRRLDWVRWLSRFTLNSRISTFNRGVEALLRLSSRTLADLDAMRADGVEFEMHSQGLMAVALSDHGLHWFDLTFAELARFLASTAIRSG